MNILIILISIINTIMPTIFWTVSPLDKITINYYTPLTKLSEMINCGYKVIILISDINLKLLQPGISDDKIKSRCDYYIKVLGLMLKELKVDMDCIEFIIGSSFQLDTAYTLDLFNLSSLVPITEINNLKYLQKTEEAKTITQLLLPSVWTINCLHINAQLQLVSNKQKTLINFAEKYLEKIGKKFGEIICYKELNISDSIDMCNTRQEIKDFIYKLSCPKEISNKNEVMKVLRDLIFPILNHNNKIFCIFRREEHGGPINFIDYNEVKKSYKNGELHYKDLQLGVINNIDLYIEPIRKIFESRYYKQLMKHSY